jgi:hypothetical protein
MAHADADRTRFPFRSSGCTVKRDLQPSSTLATAVRSGTGWLVVRMR